MQLGPDKHVPYNYKIWERTKVYEMLPKDVIDLIKDKYLYPIVDIVNTPMVDRIFRGNTYQIKEPQIHSMVRKNGSGYGDGIHRTYVVTNLKKTRKGNVSSIYINPIIEYYPSKNKAKIDMTSYTTELKPKFSKNHPRWEEPGYDINAWIFDEYVEFRNDFPYGR